MTIFGYTIKRSSKSGARNFKFQNRGQYKIVDGYGQTQIAPSSQEDRTED